MPDLLTPERIEEIREMVEAATTGDVETMGDCWRMLEAFGLARPELPLDNSLFPNARRLRRHAADLASLLAHAAAMRERIAALEQAAEDAPPPADAALRGTT